MPSSTALVPEVDPLELKSVGVLKGEYGVGIKGGGGKVRVLKGDTGKISPAEINGTGNAVGEDGIGAGKINPFHESGVGVEPTKYGGAVKSGPGKIGIHKGDTGKINSTKVNMHR